MGEKGVQCGLITVCTGGSDVEGNCNAKSELGDSEFRSAAVSANTVPGNSK